MNFDDTHHPEAQLPNHFQGNIFQKSFWNHIQSLSMQRRTENINGAVRKFCCCSHHQGLHHKIDTSLPSGQMYYLRCTLPSLIEQFWMPWKNQENGLQRVARLTASPKKHLLFLLSKTDHWTGPRGYFLCSSIIILKLFIKHNVPRELCIIAVIFYV